MCEEGVGLVMLCMVLSSVLLLIVWAWGGYVYFLCISALYEDFNFLGGVMSGKPCGHDYFKLLRVY